MKEITINTTKQKEVMDLTDDINEILQEELIHQGMCFVNVLHTTTGLSVADLDPGTDLDMLDAFDEMVPKLNYRHPHNPEHVSDHILSTLIGTSITIPIKNSRLVLGQWQKVVLFEFDGPKERKIVISAQELDERILK